VEALENIMEIKKVSSATISGFETKNIETKKSEPKSPTLGVGSAVSTFENVGLQNGSRDLGLEQSQIAGNFNFENSPTGTETTDNRSKFENRPGNPFSKADDKSSNPIADRKNGAVDPSGPTGPDYASIVEQGINREISVGDKYAEYGGNGRTKEDMRNKASGQLLMDEASQNQQQQNKYGQDGLAQDGGAGYGNVVGYDESEGVKGGSGNAAKNNPGLNQAVVQTYINGGAGSNREWALKMSEDDANPNDYTRSDGTRVQTGKDGTVVETAKDGTKTVTKPDGSSTTVRPDGSYTDKDASGKETGKGSLTQYDQDYVPIENRLDFLKFSPGAVRPRSGSNSGDIDFADDALPKGTTVDSSYLEKALLRNPVQPADPEDSYGGHSIGSSPNSGGDIDHGPDSTETGYSGASRGGDPTDLNVTVGGAPLKSSEDDSEDEEEQKDTKTKKPFIVWG
jgi:hypothetical protein